FETTTPLFIQSRTSVTGLQASEKLLAIDFRPATGQLYGITDAGRLYTINLNTGAASLVVAGIFSRTLDDVAFDFDPVTDQIRVLTDKNLRVNPTTGAVTVDSDLAFAAGDKNAG